MCYWAINFKFNAIHEENSKSVEKVGNLPKDLLSTVIESKIGMAKESSENIASSNFSLNKKLVTNEI